jgi:hypothetical protein
MSFCVCAVGENKRRGHGGRDGSGDGVGDDNFHEIIIDGNVVMVVDDDGLGGGMVCGS